MKLKIKFLEWSAGLPVAMLNKETAERIGVHTKDRIFIKSGFKSITTIIDTVEKIVKKDEIAVSSEIKKRMHFKEGQKVKVGFAVSPDSLNYIKQKLDGKKLNENQINEIIKDVVNNSLSEAEIALFISSMYNHGMTMKETIYLIKAINKNGNTLNFNHGRKVVDKHSIGGVPGNRTTPIVVSICAAAGLTIPKSSSRAITSAAGTADVIETIAKVEFPLKKLKKIVKKTNACIVWGGSLDLVPADSKIIQIEKTLKIDPQAQLLASIMSKKIAVGSKYILIDIPYGKGAKVSKKEAEKLKQKFLKLGKYFKKKMKVVLTDGTQPIGNGVGAVLEIIDVINVLKPKEKGPKDLEDKSLFLSGELLELSGKAKKGEGLELAKSILYSGKAFEKFQEIIHAQKGNLNRIPKLKNKTEIHSNQTGKIIEIDNKRISSLARLAGCPADKSAGIYLHKQVGQRVKKGEPLLTFYFESKSRIESTLKYYKKYPCIKIK